jgi:membrane-bound lytic murein transglycosylase B
MLNRLACIALLALAVGCDKSSPPPPTAAEPAAPATEPNAPAPASAEPNTEPEAASAAVDASQIPTLLAELTQVVRRYGAEQRRAPRTLDELVTQGYLTRIPEAPAGKRFAINARLEVILADR